MSPKLFLFIKDPDLDPNVLRKLIGAIKILQENGPTISLVIAPPQGRIDIISDGDKDVALSFSRGEIDAPDPDFFLSTIEGTDFLAITEGAGINRGVGPVIAAFVPSCVAVGRFDLRPSLTFNLRAAPAAQITQSEVFIPVQNIDPEFLDIRVGQRVKFTGTVFYQNVRYEVTRWFPASNIDFGGGAGIGILTGYAAEVFNPSQTVSTIGGEDPCKPLFSDVTNSSLATADYKQNLFATTLSIREKEGFPSIVVIEGSAGGIPGIGPGVDIINFEAVKGGAVGIFRETMLNDGKINFKTVDVDLQTTLVDIASWSGSTGQTTWFEVANFIEGVVTGDFPPQQITLAKNGLLTCYRLSVGFHNNILSRFTVNQSGRTEATSSLIGNQSSLDYTYFSPLGRLEMYGRARVIDRDTIEIQHVGQGQNGPSWSTYVGGIDLPFFKANKDQYIITSHHIPVNRDPAENICVEIMWKPSVSGAVGEYVRWGVEYTWDVKGSLTPLTTATLYSNDKDPADAALVAGKSYLTTIEIPTIAGDYTSLKVRLFREGLVDTFPGDAIFEGAAVCTVINSLGEGVA